VAHDLKNPFNAVQGFTDLLLDRYDELDDLVRKEYLEIIHKSSLQGTHLLETLLEWSRSQMGVINYTPQVFDLGQLVKDMIEELQEKAKSKDIELLTSVSKSSMVFGDVNMIQTVLRNLGNNALKFTHSKGVVKIDLKEGDGEVFCEVADNGVGISKEDQGRLFKLDSNFSTQGTSNEKGTGLGLVLSKEFVEKNQGRIGVRSRVDRGSIFWFTLPMADQNVEQKKSSVRKSEEEEISC
jgi:signal transduction histidine kinase